MNSFNDVIGHLGFLRKDIEELPARFTEQARINQQELARGEKYIRIPILNGQASGGVLTMGGDGSTQQTASTNQEPGPGPDTGYSWSLTEINIEGLAASDVVGLYLNTNTIQGKRIWILTGNQPHQTWGKGQKLLRYGEKLMIASIGTFTSTAVITVSGVARELPGEKEYRL